MKKIKTISVCCSAEVKTSPPLPDFFGDSIGQDITMCYMCTKCNKPCDIKEVKSHGKKKR